MDHYDRARIGRMTHPVRGLLHGTAAVVALIGALALTAEAPHGTARKLSLSPSD
jgi:hypothetical protein